MAGGLSGRGRLHDLFVTHEAMSPGEWKHGGNGMMLRYGFHPHRSALRSSWRRAAGSLGSPSPIRARSKPHWRT
jgi:hypothetical protein